MGEREPGGPRTWRTNEWARAELAAIHAEHVAAEARAQAAEGATAWRPIESAPRDGTHVILAFGLDGVMEGWWEDADPGPYPWKFVDRGVSASPFAAGEHLNGAREVRGGPTHWMPFPEPPFAIRAHLDEIDRSNEI